MVFGSKSTRKNEFEVKAPRDLDLFGSSTSFALDESISAENASMKNACARKLATRSIGLDMSEAALYRAMLYTKMSMLFEKCKSDVLCTVRPNVLCSQPC